MNSHSTVDPLSGGVSRNPDVQYLGALAPTHLPAFGPGGEVIQTPFGPLIVPGPPVPPGPLPSTAVVLPPHYNEAGGPDYGTYGGTFPAPPPPTPPTGGPPAGPNGAGPSGTVQTASILPIGLLSSPLVIIGAIWFFMSRRKRGRG